MWCEIGLRVLRMRDRRLRERRGMRERVELSRISGNEPRSEIRDGREVRGLM